MNPFKEKPIKLSSCVEDRKKLFVKSYDKDEVDPYTKVRTILMNGTEFEQNWFMHNLRATRQTMTCAAMLATCAVLNSNSKSA